MRTSQVALSTQIFSFYQSAFNCLAQAVIQVDCLLIESSAVIYLRSALDFSGSCVKLRGKRNGMGVSDFMSGFLCRSIADRLPFGRSTR